MKKFAPDVRIEADDILGILRNEIIKREIIEGDEAKIAKQKIDRFYKRLEKQKSKKEVGEKKFENETDESENLQEISDFLT